MISFSYSNYSRQDDLSSSVVVIPPMQICPVLDDVLSRWYLLQIVLPCQAVPLAMSHSHTFTFPEAEMRLEKKRKEAVWDLFQSESTFLRDHLMVVKNVSKTLKYVHS